MDRIERRLREWSEHALLDPSTLQRILDYEAGRAPDGWQWRALLILGAAIVGIGIVSLIAANWAAIPANVKLGADFALLALLAVGIWFTRPASAARETSIVLFQITCLASIGLIAQIYHLGGRPWQALGWWSVMCLPITGFARARPAWWLWGSLALLACALAAHDLLTLRMADLDRFDEGALLYAWLATTLLAGLAYNVAVLRGWRWPREVFGFWWLLLGLGYLGLIDGLHSLREFPPPRAVGLYPLLGLAGALALILAMRRDLRPASRGTLVAMVIVTLAASHPSWLFDPTSASGAFDSQDLRAAAVTLLILSGGLLVSSLQGWRWLFQLFTLSIGLRFFVVYLQAFAGLAATGVGLIVSGLLIIGLVMLWRQSLKGYQWLRGHLR